MLTYSSCHKPYIIKIKIHSSLYYTSLHRSSCCFCPSNTRCRCSTCSHFKKWHEWFLNPSLSDIPSFFTSHSSEHLSFVLHSFDCNSFHFFWCFLSFFSYISLFVTVWLVLLLCGLRVYPVVCCVVCSCACFVAWCDGYISWFWRRYESCMLWFASKCVVQRGVAVPPESVLILIHKEIQNVWSQTWKQGKPNSPTSSRYSKLNATYSSSVPDTSTQQNKPDHKKREDRKKGQWKPKTGIIPGHIFLKNGWTLKSSEKRTPRATRLPVYESLVFWPADARHGVYSYKVYVCCVFGNGMHAFVVMITFILRTRTTICITYTKILVKLYYYCIHNFKTECHPYDHVTY